MMLHTALALILKPILKARRSSIIKTPIGPLALCKGVFNPRISYSTYALALALLRNGPVKERALDLGCGSGFIALLLARMGNYTVACDVSAQACKNALVNARALGLYDRIDVVCGDASCIRDGSIDVVAINPPYLKCPWRLDEALCGGIMNEACLTLMLRGLRICRKSLYVTATSINVDLYNTLIRLAEEAIRIRTPIDFVFVFRIRKGLPARREEVSTPR